MNTGKTKTSYHVRMYAPNGGAMPVATGVGSSPAIAMQRAGHQLARKQVHFSRNTDFVLLSGLTIEIEKKVEPR